MSQFFKKFLLEEGSRLGSSPGRFLGLGAFGKHPGWDDHIEDLGLETETLTLAKRNLYVQGVGGQIDTGAWEKLEPGQRTEGFNHVFVWQRSRQFLLGKMWSSSDGKGRTRYPMVICAQCAGVSLAWALHAVLPRLLVLEENCKKTNTAQGVRSLLDGARSDLRAALASPSAGDDAALSTGELTRFVSDTAFGPDQLGWLRILYQVENQMSVYGAGKFNAKSASISTSLRPQTIRVPVAASSPEQAFLLWTRFFSTRLDRLVPLFFALSPGQAWLDAILGEPGTQEFFGLRALPAVLPLATEVPYTLDDTFIAHAKQSLADFQAGKETATPAKPVAEESSGAWTRFFRGKGSKLFLVGGVVVLAAGAAWYLNRPAGRSPVASQAQPQTQTTPTATALLQPKSNALSVSQSTAPPTAGPTGGAGQQKQPNTAPTPAAVTPAAAAKTATAPAATSALDADVKTQAQITAATAATGATRLAQQRQVTAQPTQVAATPSTGPPAAAPMTVAAVTPPQTTTASSSSSAPSAPSAQPLPSDLQSFNNQAQPSVASTPGGNPGSPFTNSSGLVLLWVSGMPGTAHGAWVSQFEVTQRQFELVMRSNPSKFIQPSQPVENVTWQEALHFCSKLTATEKAAGTLPAGFAYTLPSQAQWDFFLADARFDDAVTSRTTNPQRPSPLAVGTLAPNKFGLYDVLGNVWEWCADAGTNSDRFLKGSAFNTAKIFNWKPVDPTTTRRVADDTRSPDAGFRCILAPQP